MKKKLVALLVLVALMCWTASALAVSLPVPVTTAPRSTSDLTLPPVSPLDLPEIVSVDENNGEWVVVLNKDLFAMDYNRGSNDYAYADVGVYYELDDLGYELWYFMNETGRREGNTFYFEKPEGAELMWASIDMNIFAGNDQFYIHKDSDGSRSSSYYAKDVSWYYYYTDDNKVYDADVYSYTDDSAVWFYFAENGKLDYYQVCFNHEQGSGWIYYNADGTHIRATYYEYDSDYYARWTPDTGWNDNSKVPVGLLNPAIYEAPYGGS